MSDVLDFEVVREFDGDELGWPMALHFFGHGLDLDDIQESLDRLEDDGEIPMSPTDGWDLEETYVRKVPATFGWRFAYTKAPGRGARAVTLTSPARVAAHWCWKHPFEPWATGFPVANIVDPPMPCVSPDGYLYMCSDCATEFRTRMERARQEAYAAYKEGA